MSQGLRITNAVGSIVLSPDHKISRFRYSNEIAAGASAGSIISGIIGSSVQFSIKLGLSAFKAPHSVSKSGGTISWTAQSGNNFSSSDSLIFVIQYT